jgi:predicted dehydrogenase
MLKAAAKAKKIIAPFQQRRFEKDFLKVKEVIDSGILGEIVHIRICWQGFKRRWDWQTSRAYAGGALNNNGPHPLDHAAVLFGEGKPEVWAQAKNYLCSGDAEDHLKVILNGKNKPTVEIELTDVWAYPQERWIIAGTRGGLHGTEQKLEWKWVDFSKMPERTLSMESTPDRSYNSEKLEWQTATWQPEGPAQASGAGAAPPVDAVNTFYQGLFQTIRNHQPLAIPPQEIKKRVALLEVIRKKAGIHAKK